MYRLKKSQYMNVKMQVLYTANSVLSQFQTLLLQQNNAGTVYSKQCAVTVPDTAVTTKQ